MQPNTINTLHPINPELEEIKLKHRGQTFWARTASILAGVVSGYKTGSVLTQRALLKRLYDRLHIVDITPMDERTFEYLPQVDEHKITEFDLNPHVRIAKKGWEAQFLEGENSILGLLHGGTYANGATHAGSPDSPISPLVERPDESVKSAFVLTCRKDPDGVYTKAKEKLKTALADIARDYEKRTKPLVEDHTKVLQNYEALKATALPNSAETEAALIAARSKLELLEHTLWKEQKNLRKACHTAWTEKFENTIFRHMIKSGNINVGRMSLGLRHAGNKMEIIGISSLVAAATAIISYSMIRLSQYYSEDKNHQRELEKKATIPSEHAKNIAADDVVSISQSPEPSRQFATEPKMVTPLAKSDSAVARVMEQRGVADSATLSL